MWPGTVTLFGSGETSSTGARIFDALARQIAAPLRIAVLETPAGFEANAARVAGRVSDFLTVHLQNYHPRLSQVAARKKGTPLSPDAPEVVAPLYESNLIFLGPGSPTYTVRQLQDSLAWHILQARHRQGASLVFASAAAIAAGNPALPVYEIFKVGEDPHWKPGLDLLRPFGLSCAILPHWNNNDGGAELDTSRCFMGQDRFGELLSRLPEALTVLGIDESTAITLDFQAETCRVAGQGSVHVLRGGQEQQYAAGKYAAGSDFAMRELGDYHPLLAPDNGLPPEVWQQAQQVTANLESVKDFTIPSELQELIEEREAARKQRDWPRADRIRQQITDLGWKVSDSPEGPQVQPLD